MFPKKLYSLFIAFSLFCVTQASAQMPDSLICPNFTGVDLNGGSHTLYNYLDSGYTVVIEVSAAWCAPCWAYHTSGVLKNFYNTYGPTGTNKVRVMYIEGEATNTVAQLNGTSSGTARSTFSQGNWVAGTPYPIIDDATIARLLRISFYPTIYSISPNRQIVQIQGRTAAALTDQLAKTVVATGTSNMAISQYTGFNEAFCRDKAVSPQIKVQNLGTDSIKSAQITLKVNNSLVETKVLTGLTMKKYDTLMVNFNSVNLVGNSALTFDITTVNGVADAFTYRNSGAYNLLKGPITDLDSVTVEIKTDQDPGETYWKIVDQAGLKIAEGGNPNVLPNTPQATLANAGNYQAVNTVYTQRVGLKRNTCYDVILWDDYGDGMTNVYSSTGAIIGTVGYMKILTNTGGTLYYNLGNTLEFGELKRPIERSNVLGIKNIEGLNSLTANPSPVNELLTVDFSLERAKDLTISVVNVLGQTLKVLPKQLYTEGSNKVQIPTDNFASGIYFIHVKNDNATAVHKFMIQH
jgi:hypothetical protein